jgi:hypothetical protein
VATAHLGRTPENRRSGIPRATDFRGKRGLAGVADEVFLLSTNLLPTGSGTKIKTTGIEVVASLA